MAMLNITAGSSFPRLLVLSLLRVLHRPTAARPATVSTPLYASPKGGKDQDFSASAQIKPCAKPH